MFVYIAAAVGIALIANIISAVWARGDNLFSPWLAAVIIISPMVFIVYGLMTTRLGVAISSGVIDSLLTVSTIAVGLILFQEWHKISMYQFAGLACVVTGILLMLFIGKTGA